jgi:hypothetical protein
MYHHLKHAIFQIVHALIEILPKKRKITKPTEISCALCEVAHEKIAQRLTTSCHGIYD